MNKQECVKALETLQEKYINLDVVDELICFKNLIDERYDLERNFKILEKNYDELYDMVHYQKPYKFEDLKPNMFVFDKDFNGWGEILRIVEICVNKYGEKLVKCLATGDSSLQTRSYKENRFYPITKAMEWINDGNIQLL